MHNVPKTAILHICCLSARVHHCSCLLNYAKSVTLLRILFLYFKTEYSRMNKGEVYCSLLVDVCIFAT